MYRLADGTKSTDYKIGDRFEVVKVDNSSVFSLGSVLEFKYDDGTAIPKFTLISGENIQNDNDYGYERWKFLKPTLNAKTQESSIKEAITTLQSLIAWPEITLQLSEGDVFICVFDRKFSTLGEDVAATLETVNMLVGQEVPE